METRQHFLYLLCNVIGKSERRIKKHIAGFVGFSHGKPGKSWNARISFSMPEKSCHIFPFFLFSQSSVSYFSIFLSNHAAGHAVIGPCGEKRAI